MLRISFLCVAALLLQVSRAQDGVATLVTCPPDAPYVSVEGIQGAYCVVTAGNICTGEDPTGRCPEPQEGLPQGSHCTRVFSGVYGCRPVGAPEYVFNDTEAPSTATELPTVAPTTRPSPATEAPLSVDPTSDAPTEVPLVLVEPPDTEAPTQPPTQIPTTEPPAPITEAPTPATQAPATQAPLLVLTEEPVTQAPAPVTQAPAPVTQAPAPVTQAPAPVTQAPAPVTQTPAPVTQAPAPVTQAPAPVTQAPAPVTQAPAPVTETPAPVTNAPTIGSPYVVGLIECPEGAPYISVEGVEGAFCIAHPGVICSGAFSTGLCPEAQLGLERGSYCTTVRTGVYGCRPTSAEEDTAPRGYENNLDTTICVESTPVSVVGAGTFCVEEPVCSADVFGNCPRAQEGLPVASRCERIPTGVYGCVV